MVTTENEFSLSDVAWQGHSFLLKFWVIVFGMAVLLILHPLLGNLTPALKVPLHIERIHMFKDVFFILFAMLIISIFFIKKTWLSYQVLSGMVRQNKDFKKTWGLPIPPLSGELVFGHGLLYHVRKTILLVYVVLMSSTLLCEVYFWFTGDRRNIFLYAIIVLFSLMLNYPRKSMTEKLVYLIEENDNDQK